MISGKNTIILIDTTVKNSTKAYIILLINKVEPFQQGGFTY